MTMIAHEARRQICPGCSTEWVQHRDGMWENDAVFRGRWFDAYRGDPVPAGRRFCPVCAVRTATTEDRKAYIKVECLEADFLEWLLKEASREDVMVIFNVLEAHAPELMETRLGEFVEDQADDEFTEWRCGI